MKKYLTVRKWNFTHPAKQEPAWSSKVERWYQLDAFAYGLADAYWEWKTGLSPNPEMIFLASALASNCTDSLFVKRRATSPSQFVHTLPNIRSSSVLELMNGSTPLLCIQNDPATQCTALKEALLWPQKGPIWVLSLTAHQPDFTAHWYELSLDPPLGAKSSVFEIDFCGEDPQNMALPRMTDEEWLDWLNSAHRSPKIRFREGLELREVST